MSILQIIGFIIVGIVAIFRLTTNLFHNLSLPFIAI